MDTNIDWNLIIRHLDRDCSPEEEVEVTEWMNVNPDHQEFIMFLETIWQMDPVRKRGINADAAWQRFTGRYDLDEQVDPDLPDTKAVKPSGARGRVDPGVKRSISWIGITGVGVSILAILLVLFQMFQPPYSLEAATATGDVEYREMTTERGQRARIILGDGSVVHLNSESYLKIPEVFRKNGVNRLYLEGEAYFEITNSEATRFEVIANGSITTVLGTKFNVRSYPEDRMVTVVVASGEVSLGYYGDTETSPAYLYGNQKGVIGAGFVPEVSDVQNLSMYLGWTFGELVFEEEPLPELIRKLERWFGIEIETEGLDEESMSKKLTASFSERQPLDDVLQSISLVLDLSLEEARATEYQYKLSK